MPERIDYPYDAAPGLYGYQSHEVIAGQVIKGFKLNQHAQAASELVENFANPHSFVAPIGDFRLSSLVESSDDDTGWALAVAPIDKLDETNLGGVLFRVNRYGRYGYDEPEVDIASPIPVIHSEAMRNKAADNPLYKQEVKDLVRQFSKIELEVIARTLGKMTTALNTAHEMQDMDDANSLSPNLSGAARAKILNAMLRANTRMKTAAAIEPRVFYALQNYQSDALGALFPGIHIARTGQAVESKHQLEDEAGSIEHISEWQELISAAEHVLDKEADPSQAMCTVALQHEVDTSHYMINLRSEYGALTGIQLLREDTGALQVQTFDLGIDSDEDGVGENHVGSAWNRAAILECATQGTKASNEAYEAYRVMAETSLGRPIDRLIN